METLKIKDKMEILKNYNLFVLAEENELNEESLHILMERYIKSNVRIQIFSKKEACMKCIEEAEIKPDIIVLFHKLNLKSPDDIYTMHTMDEIKKISPKSAVIIVSEAKDMTAAVKSLRHGAQDYILKDQFLFPHIADSVNQCLKPSKV